ncbi:hypothetical protein DSO57_1035838 [Entomophthora muscae]|uniref:Uncharacterized protein n=3 Tax=Entomophthora muscae TaxID=34485 RepID=A0ACC2SNJ6_9FUNG|nr:hypothetical protein DSO57_1035838 [Entomophthora muscae]
MRSYIPLSFLGVIAAQFSSDNRCGTQNKGLMCDPQGPYGGCCSKFGYCGSSSVYCAVDNGCQSGCNNGTVAAPAEAVKGCGDGFCDVRSETCNSCPKDCGVCQLQYLDKCIIPGQVALTFDDGPDQYANQLMAIANQLNVKLTMFVIGNKLKNPTYQRYLKKYHAAGHTIASHTYSHPFITKLTDDQLREEMSKTDDAIHKIIGVRPIFMRNPYSDSNQRTMALLESMGYKSIFTSLDTEDTVFGVTEPSRIITNTIQGLKADPKLTPYVITQHETYKSSVSSLPRIVAEIHKRRYTIVSIEKCFGTDSAYRKDVCGDGKCTGYIENCSTCPKDCGVCPKY